SGNGRSAHGRSVCGTFRWPRCHVWAYGLAWLEDWVVLGLGCAVGDDRRRLLRNWGGGSGPAFILLGVEDVLHALIALAVERRIICMRPWLDPECPVPLVEAGVHVLQPDQLSFAQFEVDAVGLGE